MNQSGFDKFDGDYAFLSNFYESPCKFEGDIYPTVEHAFQAAKTITPSTTDQIVVSSGYYTGGNITVKGDSNLIAGNIKVGMSIFGVNGTAEVNSGSDSNNQELVDLIEGNNTFRLWQKNI